MSHREDEHAEWTERLSDFLDGGLEPEARERTEAHLAGCGRCRRVLEELSEVRDRARSLGPVEPERDLWAGIAATIEAPSTRSRTGARVITLPTSRALPVAGERRARGEDPVDQTARPSAPRRFSLTLGQLAAASVVLVVASTFVTWSLGRTAVEVGPGAEVAPGDATGFVASVSTPPEPPPDLARELATLERLLGEARTVLDPNTVRILQRNLAIVEQAILDSRRALAQDPENDFLAEHLRRVYERKLEYLRDAVRVAEQVS